MLKGFSLIDGKSVQPTGRTFVSANPVNGQFLQPEFHEVDSAGLERVNDLASRAFVSYGRSSGADRARFLRTIAREIEALGDTLLERFTEETGLPRARAEGERARTCAQLRLFADAAENARWADARIDPADPQRKPLPKPDTRYVLRPIGPIAVLGPANFPLAFGVAGADVASAFAAGCPVIVKAHSAHPGVSELVGRAVTRAVAACELPAGTFSLVFGGNDVAAALVQLPGIRGVGFTGSRSGGRALMRLCQNRATPIPFFGELASLNPLCILPHALEAHTTSLVEGLHASVTGSCGQLCTKPGAVFFVGGTPAAEHFSKQLRARISATPVAPMLTADIRSHFAAGVKQLGETPGVETLVALVERAGPGYAHASAALLSCDSATFRAQAALHEEVFGPATLLVSCRDVADMTATVATLEGQLTATLHEAGEDMTEAHDLLRALEERSGRLIFNGYPTGVEVCSSMVHGGPWPATTDARFTSVGTAAIFRFARPVCYQNAPQSRLPVELRE